MPLLKNVPVVRLLVIAELALLAQRHVQRLEPEERVRLVVLLSHGRGMPASERTELRALVAKLDVPAFAGSAAGRLLPHRITSPVSSLLHRPT